MVHALDCILVTEINGKGVEGERKHIRILSTTLDMLGGDVGYRLLQ